MNGPVDRSFQDSQTSSPEGVQAFDAVGEPSSVRLDARRSVIASLRRGSQRESTLGEEVFYSPKALTIFN